MGFFGRLFGFEQRAALTASQMAEGIFVGPGGFRGPPRRGTRELLAAYRQSPWLRAVASRIAKGIAAAEWSVYVRTDAPTRGKARLRQRRGTGGSFTDVERVEAFRWGQDKAVRDVRLIAGTAEQRAARRRELAAEGLLKEVIDHPILDLLNSPNRELTGRSTIQMTQTWLDIKGEAFWALSKDETGKPAQFMALPPHWVTGVPTRETPYFLVNYGGFQSKIAPVDMIWLRDPDPENPYGRGTGVGESLGDELETDEFASKYVKNWFFNSGLPSAIVSFEGATTENVKVLKESWENSHRGYQNAHRVHFAGGKMNAQRLDASFKDQEVTGLRKLERDTIAQVFAMPPEVIGIIENSNRSTIGAARYIYALGVEHPRAEFLRSELQAQLAPLFDEAICLECEVSVPDDDDRRLNVMRTLPGAYSVNEWREEAGYEAVPEFDGVFPPLGQPGQIDPNAEPVDQEKEEPDEGEGADVEESVDPPWVASLRLVASRTSRG